MTWRSRMAGGMRPLVCAHLTSMSLSLRGMALEVGRRPRCARLVFCAQGPSAAALRPAGTVAWLQAVVGNARAPMETRLLRSLWAELRCPVCAPSLDICAASSSTSKGLDWQPAEASHASGDRGPSPERAVGLLGPTLPASLLHWQLMCAVADGVPGRSRLPLQLCRLLSAVRAAGGAAAVTGPVWSEHGWGGVCCAVAYCAAKCMAIEVLGERGAGSAGGPGEKMGL